MPGSMGEVRVMRRVSSATFAEVSGDVCPTGLLRYLVPPGRSLGAVVVRIEP